jgi:hypothetical protein
MSKIPRFQFKSYLNTTSTTGAVYSLIGVGVPDATVNMNPEVTTEHNIHEESGTTFVERYAPTMPVEMTANNGDAVFEYVDNLRRNAAVLDDAETDVVQVYIYETSSTGGYPADKFSVSISVDTYGGPGGQAVKMAYTINYQGDRTEGAFNPTTLAFTTV